MKKKKGSKQLRKEAYKREHEEHFKRLGFGDSEIDVFALGTIEEIIETIQGNGVWRGSYDDVIREEEKKKDER